MLTPRNNGPAAAPEGDSGFVRLRLDISYDGTDFSGWARQPERRTVCGTLEEALSTVLRTPLTLTVAGRTDAGVHASGQVAHVDVAPGLVGDDPSWLVARLARLLPPDVRVREVHEVPDSFDARFAALRRHYAYRLTTASYGADPVRVRDTVAWPRVLDLDRMRVASALLLGEHDFVAFCRRRDGAGTVRDLLRLDWEPDGELLVARVSADAFCHSMVRSLVGALLAVGEGRRSAEWVRGLLSASARESSVGVAPARGLSLTAVDYPETHELAARTRTTRARRELSTLAEPLVNRPPASAPAGKTRSGR